MPRVACETNGRSDPAIEASATVALRQGEEPATLEERFAHASTDAAASILHKLTQEDMLALYGWYKIVTVGPNPNNKGGFMMPRAAAKHKAWKKLGNMPREEAMAAYVNFIKNAGGV